MSQPAPGTLNLEQLLHVGLAAARAGNSSAARALFLALSREYPQEVRVWRALADVAGDDDERRVALEHVRDLDPADERAALALQAGAAAPARSSSRPGYAVPPLAEPDDQPVSEQAPFPLLNLIALVVILLLLVAVGLIIGRNLLPTAGRASATVTPVLAALPTAPLMLPTAPPALPTSLPPPTLVPTRAPLLTPSSVPTMEPTLLPSLSPTPQQSAGETATAELVPTVSTELPMGTIIDNDGWSATLLRPDYAVALEGPIGDLYPNGRFVLAVVAVSNNSPTPRTIPPELFSLLDAVGRNYSPVPGLSSAYLGLYGRGQRGDLALEDVLEPASGMRSVPVIFDVPLDATGLRLTMPSMGGAGWPINAPAPAPVGP